MAMPKPEIQGIIPNSNYGHPQKFTEGRLNSVHNWIANKSS